MLAGETIRPPRRSRRALAAALPLLLYLAVLPGRARAQGTGTSEAEAAAHGVALFTGKTRFKNGGPACASCHPVANISSPHGATVGPELTHEYSTLGPDSFGEALKSLFFPSMVNLYKKRPLTPEERRDLLSFFQSVDLGVTPGQPFSAPAAAAAAAPAPSQPPSPAAIAAGQALFNGNLRFTNGGPACASCHSASNLPFPYGGTMGPDLTHEYSKLGPEGLKLSLRTLYFPAMVALFNHRPLTLDEQANLGAFLESVDRSQPRQATLPLGVIALAGLLVLVIWTWTVGRRRVRSVRQALLERAAGGKRR